MELADARKASSLTRIPVSVSRCSSDDIKTPRGATGISQTRADAARANPVVVGGRRISATSALATVTAKEPLERQMDTSMETMFRRWDAETTSVAVAEVPPASRLPASKATGGNGIAFGPPATRAQQRMRVSQCDGGDATGESSCGGRLKDDDVTGGRAVTIERRHRADSNNNNGQSSGEDDINAGAVRSPTETRCSYSTPGVLPSSEFPGCLTNGGDRRDVFRVDFDAEGYSPDDITVRVAGSRLTVHGIRRETDEPDGRSDAGGGLRRTTTEFCRRIRLPDDVDRAGLTCVMIGSRLVVEAPRTLPCQRNGDGLTLPRRPDDLTSSRGCASDRTMSTPTIRVNVDETGVREMSLDVDIGRVFRPDDVTVKVKNSTLTLTVVAERVECSPVPMAADGESAGKCPTAGGSLRRLNAHQTWEFDLPGAAEMDTLKAGLTVDGMLKITATMKPQQDRQQTIAG